MSRTIFTTLRALLNRVSVQLNCSPDLSPRLNKENISSLIGSCWFQLIRVEGGKQGSDEAKSTEDNVRDAVGIKFNYLFIACLKIVLNASLIQAKTTVK